MRKCCILLILFSLLCASCAAPAEPAPVGITLTPAATAAAPATAAATATATPTATPTATATTAATAAPPLRLGNIRMFTETGGWAVGFNPDGVTVLLHTADGGQSWQAVTPQFVSKVPFLTSFLNENTAWVYNENTLSAQPADSGTLARTTDGGSTWAVINQALLQDFLFQSAGMTFLDLQQGWTEVYAVGAGQAHIQIYTTHDSGASWSQVMLGGPADVDNTGENPGTLHLCNICGDSFYYDPLRQLITYGDLASGDRVGKVRVSIAFDQGKTWKDFTLPFPSAKYADASVAPQEPVFFNKTEGILPVGLVKFNPDWTLAYSALAIYTTQDGGLSWTPKPLVLENASNLVSRHSVVDFISEQDAFAACGADLCVTHDGAQTWQALHSSLNFTYSETTKEYVAQFDFVSAAVGWAISTDGDTASLWKTTDGGRSWEKLNSL